MCCPLNQAQGRFIIDSDFTQDKGTYLLVKGKVNTAPQTWGHLATSYLQKLEIAEKIAEIADEGFHLLGSLIKPFVNLEVYTYLKDLHDGAHHLEKGLHAFCFIGDLIRIYTGKFIERDHGDHGHVNYMTTAARLAHTVSHFFASMQFLTDLKLVTIQKLEPYLKYYHLISAIGFAISTVELLHYHLITAPTNAATLKSITGTLPPFEGCRHDKDKNAQKYSDIIIHGSGALFEGFNHGYVAEHPWFKNSYAYKIGAIFGIVHAFHVASRLMPSSIPVKPFKVIKPREAVAVAHHHTEHHHTHNHTHHAEHANVHND